MKILLTIFLLTILLLLTVIRCTKISSYKPKNILKFVCSDSGILPLDLYLLHGNDSLIGTINTTEEAVLLEGNEQVIIIFSSVENLSITRFPFNFLDDETWKIDLYFIK